MKGPQCPWPLSFQELLVLPTHFPFRVFVLGRRKTQGKRRTLFPGQFMVARRTQVPSSARPLREGCNNPKRAKATLFRELPHLFWPISSSFYKDLGWAVRAEGKRPLKKESKSYFRKSCSQRAGRGRCLCTMGVRHSTASQT